jgi:hypothetical protein
VSGFDESKAKERFILLNLVRLAGISLVLIAIAFSQMAPNVPAALNIVLGLTGMGIFFWPRRLASQWKSEVE